MRLEVCHAVPRAVRLSCGRFTAELLFDERVGCLGGWVRRPPWFAGWFAWLALPGFEVFLSWWWADVRGETP